MSANRVIQEIEEERNRQIKEEGFDAEHDDSYRAGDLGMGAVAYVMSACTNEPFPEGWMWQLSSVYKPTGCPPRPNQSRRNDRGRNRATGPCERKGLILVLRLVSFHL